MVEDDATKEGGVTPGRLRLSVGVAEDTERGSTPDPDAVPSSVDAQPCPGGISNTFPAPELLSASSTA